MSSTNSYSKLGKREVSYEHVPKLLPATSCFVTYSKKINKNKQVPSQELNAKWLHVYLSTAKIATYVFT